jgi:Tfp pilus assembly protein PilF
MSVSSQVEAFKAFRDAVTVDPKLIQGWDNLAATAHELGAPHVAEKAWMQAPTAHVCLLLLHSSLLPNE